MQTNGFLTRLARDRRGNTIAMMAIALIPLSMLVGSAIDTSRMYYVKVRLQQACDSGALAGRKFMSDGTTFTAEANAQAETFFDNNFRVGTFGTTSRARTFTRTSDNQVRGEASTVVPMTLTRILGAEESTLSVTCQAKLEVPNLDVMFVLDTTGSMSETNAGDTQNRITILRNSVMGFYDALEAAKAGTSRIRYGFMPYSTTVNVGLLLRRDWMVDNWTYQSRERADTTSSTTTGVQPAYNSSSSGWTKQSGTSESFITYGNPESCSAPSSTISSPATSTAWVSNGAGGETRTTTQTINGSNYSATLANGVCKITETRYTNYVQTRTDTRTPNPNAGQPTSSTSTTYWWNYKPVSVNVSVLKGSLGTGLMAGGTVTAEINGGGGSAWSNRNILWNSTNACIEERDTVRQSDYSTIPASAYDLNIDMVPQVGNAATQWRPWIPNLVYARKYGSYTNPTVNTTGWPIDVTATVRHNGNYVNLISYPNDYAACPSPAKKLAEITRADLKTYTDNLKIGGRTYHDIGFLWGVRLASAEGIFASENTTAPNGSAIARHIIFMTDGQTETNFADYDAYGLAALDRRRVDASRLPVGNGETNTIVENRLAALCQAAQRKNMTVWVIAFGTTLSPLLSGCATPGGHAFQANNATELNNAFAAIAANIAKLRVSQ